MKLHFYHFLEKGQLNVFHFSLFIIYIVWGFQIGMPFLCYRPEVFFLIFLSGGQRWITKLDSNEMAIFRVKSCILSQIAFVRELSKCTVHFSHFPKGNQTGTLYKLLKRYRIQCLNTLIITSDFQSQSRAVSARPTTCFGCHEDDYNNADDPNHLSANFPTNCLECHSEDAWEPANFDHDGGRL